jgi:hypothetical protein
MSVCLFVTRPLLISPCLNSWTDHAIADRYNNPNMLWPIMQSIVIVFDDVLGTLVIIFSILPLTSVKC